MCSSDLIAVSLCLAVSYLIPSLAERSLALRFGPFWAYVVLGDLVGCVAIGALTRWELGFGLYVLVDVVEIIIYRTQVLSLAGLAWLSDLVPTLMLCFLVVIIARVRGGLLLEQDMAAADRSCAGSDQVGGMSSRRSGR